MEIKSRPIWPWLMILPLLAWLLWLLLPRPDLLGHTSYSSAYLDRHGELLWLSLAHDQRYRLPITLDETASALIEATLLYEDRNFYRHYGVDLPAMLRATWQSLHGQRRVGGSTITMQLARLRYRLPHSLRGKLLQIARAIQIERHYHKDEILAAYLSLAPYGRNIEGAEAASRIYFDKPASAISLPEAMALALIPQNPRRRNPTSEAGRAALLAAQQALSGRWQAEHGETLPLNLALRFRPPEALPMHAPQRIQAIHQGGLAGPGPQTTTLDARLQDSLETLLARHLDTLQNQGIDNGALLVLDYRDMALRAAVGSADYFNPAIAGQVDGSRAPRSPGSALKPLLYALALEQGLIHPMSLLHDAPRRLGSYTPENFDRHFSGPLLAQDALIHSRNVPAVSLFAELAPPGLHGLLAQAEVQGLREADHYGMALVLGGMEIRMEELALLYAMLANHGQWRPLRQLADTAAEPGKHLLSPEAAWLSLEMLRHHPAPHQRQLPGVAVRQARQVAWKTGTSHGFRDAWALGVSGPYVVAVWLGHFDGRGNPALVGRNAAGPLLFAIIEALAAQSADWPEPAFDLTGLRLQQEPMCAIGGDLPGAHCPLIRPGWFIPGVSPLRVETIHRQIPLLPNGLRACRHRPPHTSLAVYEFWPSELQAIFARAGIHRPAPPPYGEDCPLDRQASQGQAPQIRSPQAGLTYTLQAGREQIPLQASHDAGVSRLYWFADQRLLGQVAAGETLFWSAESGNWAIRVVDDHGRSASVGIQVRQH
ncbi:MAG: penicillin-binding protein 1C [Chromatiales bacterium]|nr:penicillin-binding protein 1C [Chromatiales bacterium]